MGACNQKEGQTQAKISIDFHEFLYFNRNKGKIVKAAKKKLVKHKFKTKFPYSIDSAVCHLTGKRLMIIGGTIDNALTPSCTIIHLSNNKTQTISDLPVPCRLGSLHEIDEWVYYIGSHLSLETLSPGPLFRYNQRLNSWSEVKETAKENSLFKSLINYGSCMMGKKIYIFGGQSISENKLKANKTILSISLDSNFVMKNEGNFPLKINFPVLASGEKHGLVVGGFSSKTGEYNKTGYYILVREGVLSMHKLDPLSMEFSENYPPIYTRDYALFISYPNIAVRYRNKSTWTTFCLKKNSKKSQLSYSAIEKQRISLTNQPYEKKEKNIEIKTEIVEEDTCKSSKSKSNSRSSSSSSSDSSKKKHKKHKKQKDSNKINDEKLEVEVDETNPIIGEDVLIKSNEIPQKPPLSPISHKFPKPTLDMGKINLHQRNKSQVIVKKNSHVHLKSFSSGSLRSDAENKVNGVEISIKQCNKEGEIKTQYIIKKNADYTNSSSSSSSSSSINNASNEKKVANSSANIAEYLGLSPKNAELSNNTESKRKFFKDDEKKDEEVSNSPRSSSRSSSYSSSSSSSSSSSEDFPVQPRERVKRTHTIVSVDSSDVSDDENDEIIKISNSQLKNFFSLLFRCLDFEAEFDEHSNLNVKNITSCLETLIPIKKYSIQGDFFRILNEIHSVVGKLPLKEKEKWNIVLTSKLLPEYDEIDEKQLGHGLSRAFKYILLRAR